MLTLKRVKNLCNNLNNLHSYSLMYTVKYFYFIIFLTTLNIVNSYVSFQMSFSINSHYIIELKCLDK